MILESAIVPHTFKTIYVHRRSARLKWPYLLLFEQVSRITDYQPCI